MAVVFDYLDSNDLIRCNETNVFTENEWFSIISQMKAMIRIAYPEHIKNFRTARFVSLYGGLLEDQDLKELKGLYTLNSSEYHYLTDVGLKYL
jgi:hypothetical protein